jgi:hypothetical protein
MFSLGYSDNSIHALYKAPRKHTKALEKTQNHTHLTLHPYLQKQSGCCSEEGMREWLLELLRWYFNVSLVEVFRWMTWRSGEGNTIATVNVHSTSWKIFIPMIVLSKGRYHSPSPSYTADDSPIQHIGSLVSESTSDTTNDNWNWVFIFPHSLSSLWF